MLLKYSFQTKVIFSYLTLLDLCRLQSVAKYLYTKNPAHIREFDIILRHLCLQNEDRRIDRCETEPHQQLFHKTFLLYNDFTNQRIQLAICFDVNTMPLYMHIYHSPQIYSSDVTSWLLIRSYQHNLVDFLQYIVYLLRTKYHVAECRPSQV